MSLIIALLLRQVLTLFYRVTYLRQRHEIQRFYFDILRELAVFSRPKASQKTQSKRYGIVVIKN
jgi:DNA polymerase III delta subunit